MSILKKLLHKCSYQLGGKKVGKFYPDLVEDDNERNMLTQEAIRRDIPIKNNNSLKPTTQYKRVNKKDNNVSPRFF